MLIAVFSITVLGVVLGVALGIASRVFHVEGNPVVAEVEAILPGSNCGQCGFPGCSGAASAVVNGVAPATMCPPGGKALAQALADKLGLSLDLSTVVDDGPKLALVAEEICIGCCRCIKVCPTDAIVGGAKQIHSILREACTGCGICIDRCPTEAMRLAPVPVSLPHWVWPKPAAA